MRSRTVVAVALLASCNGDPPAQTASSSESSASSEASETSTSTGDETPTTGVASTGATDQGDTSTGEPVDILELLLAIDGLEVEERESPEPEYRYFVMTYQQPADHMDPDGLQFPQRLMLLHRDSAAPLVLSTSGYFIYPDSPGLNELSTLLRANQLVVEHRFFTPSRPEPADWATLTIEQAAADLHRIAGAFKQDIYQARWLATGASKGGMTAVYFRRYYPDDVDATVAYVAPHSLGTADPRYPAFLAQVGDQACRDALALAQRELLLRRPAMIERMQAMEVDGYTYTLLGEDRALESAALELPFSFWQYSPAEDCATVPPVTASDEEIWEFATLVASPTYWADHQATAYEPYFWQAATQLGYPQYDESNVADLLLYPGVDVAATYVFDKAPMFDPAAMPAISDWIDSEGRALLFIYGENDPYTAAAFAPGGAEDSYVFIAPGENHGARILDLEPGDQAQALAALAAWSGVEPKIPRRSPARRFDDSRRPPGSPPHRSP